MKYIILIIIIIIILSLIGIYLLYKNKQEKDKLNNTRLKEALKNIEILIEQKEIKLDDIGHLFYLMFPLLQVHILVLYILR